MMRSLTAIVALLALTVLPACVHHDSSAEQIYGSWRVMDVICNGCDGPVLSLKSKLIQIAKERVVNPAGDDCPSPGLEFVNEKSSPEVLAGPGSSWPKAVRDAVASHPRVLYGFVTCRGVNYMQIALVSPDTSFYFLEGDTALALTRLK